jgi:hypothetical protein
MRLTFATILAAIPVASGTAASAHPGHLADLAGHDHWVAGAAIGIALGLGAWAAWKGRKDKAAGAAPEAAETEEEAAA